MTSDHSGEGRPARETWRDWVPDAGDPALLTRAEVLARLERYGLNVSERTLRYWESQGVLPAPTVEKEGKPGYYPWWFIDLVFHVRGWRDDGLPLSDIKPRARYSASRLARPWWYNDAAAFPVKLTDFMREHVFHNHIGMAPRDPAGDLARVLTLLPLATFANTAHRLAGSYGRDVGQPITRVALQIETADGNRITVPIPAPPPTQEEGETLSGSGHPDSE